MKNLNVYLAFEGQCEEALNLYKDCFGGDIVSMQRYGESPAPSPEGYEQKIMHATFQADGIFLMACDTSPEHPVQTGNNVHLSINLDDAAAQKTIFERLSAGGQVTMPLQATFWGAEFGMLTDRFGINWMLNRETGAQAQ